MKTLLLNQEIYSLRVIFSAIYLFLDEFYFFLELKEDKIEVQIKAKEGEKDLERLADDFKNELINASLRLKISEENRKIREMIVATALYGSQNLNVEKKINDPEGILKTWEETYECSCKNEKIDDPEGILKTWEESHNEIQIHKAVNRSIVKTEESSHYLDMFKEKDEHGDKAE